MYRKVSFPCCPYSNAQKYLYSLLDHVLGPRYFFVGDGVFFDEVLQVVVGGDLAELVVLFEELGDLALVGVLIDFIGGVELLDEVHHPEDAVDLLFVLDLGPLRAAQLHALIHGALVNYYRQFL